MSAIHEKSEVHFGMDLLLNPTPEWIVEQGEGGKPVGVVHKQSGNRFVLDPQPDDITGCYVGRRR